MLGLFLLSWGGICLLLAKFLVVQLDVIDTASMAKIALVLAVVPPLLVHSAKTIKKAFSNKFDASRIRDPLFLFVFLYILLILFSFFQGALGTPYMQEFLFDSWFLMPVSVLVAAFCFGFHGCDKFVDAARNIMSGRFVFQGSRQFYLSWLVKFIFIPYMYSGSLACIETFLLSREFSGSNPGNFVMELFFWGVSVDILIGMTGYVFAFRALNAEVISTDESLSGWIFCLLCYPPMLWVFGRLREVADYGGWESVSFPLPGMEYVWAAILILLWACYWSATVCFGIRFSNLSWRGLVDTGLYRFVKHPAYIAKNLYWWMLAVPVLGAVSLTDAVIEFLVMGYISMIYFARAKTEERHLMKFKEYREYADYISKNGFLSLIYGRIKLFSGKN